MPKQPVSGEDPVPKLFWLMVGGNFLTPPPTWDRFLLVMDKRNKAERETKAERREFKKAKEQAEKELKALKQANKDAFKGGLAAWRQQKRDAKTNSDEGNENGTGREDRQPENDPGGNGGEIDG
ncbi:uncharacterized protein ColSpa_00138 [Colletotrichum spaethianum]|uniref:Uncharacterized protein n=1 Tax=Colletotrichum spaethianum TaxID=700344 RepID=A0AA37L8U1_9PEZI|nr:uncharacterized protein ColSpa_00138 [Colletotrichum spaethianum]GKT39957.1 hypothetical protein ColSpa_00138 [Colletotrichum spaethianum]